MKKLILFLALFLMMLSNSKALTVVVSANPDTVCLGTTIQLEANVFGGTLPYTYSWTSSPQGFYSSSPIPIATPSFTAWYICTVTDAAQEIGKDSVLVTVLYAPGSIDYIIGPLEVCKDAIENYSVVEAVGADSYVWALPLGATIIEGMNTSVVTIRWGSTSGTLSVVAVNTCGDGIGASKSISIFTPPDKPGEIEGPAEMCKYGTSNFTVGNVNGAASYQWTVPPDADILNGQGFKTVKVHWGETPGVISVACSNFCGLGESSSKSITLGTLPADAGVITGRADPCKGQAGFTYSVEAISGASSYIWTLPAGATINGPSDGNSIVVDFSTEATSGDLTVKGHSSCGDGASTSKTLILNDCNAVETLHQSGLFSIYPNPVRHHFTLGFKKSVSELELSISNLEGKVLYRETLNHVQSDSQKVVDVTSFTKGVYIIKLKVDKDIFVEKIIVMQ